MANKVDLLTGEKFSARRANQKFISSKNRVQYHNKRAAEIRKAKSQLERPLNDNFRVLTALLDGKKTGTYHKEYLLGKGFTFGVMTHHMNYEGKAHRAIYNFLIMDIGNDQFKIVKYE